MARAGSIVCLVLALVGCGGGGGGAGGISVTYDPPTALLCQRVGRSDTLYLDGSLSRMPRDVEVVAIDLDLGVFDASRTSVYQDGSESPNQFEVELVSLSSLPVGVYEGTASFEMCRDAGCSSKYELSGATLPYRVEVLPPLTLSVAIDGDPVAGGGVYGQDYDVLAGQTVTITANYAVDWSPDERAMADAVTETTWSGTISGTSNMFPVRMLAEAHCRQADSWDLFFTVVDP